MFSEKYAQAFSGRDEKVVDELKSELFALPCGGLGVDVDLVWNIKQSPEACLSAVGVLLELTEKVATSHLSNAFALVRPPGHHAEAIRPLWVKSSEQSRPFRGFTVLGYRKKINYCFARKVRTCGLCAWNLVRFTKKPIENLVFVGNILWKTQEIHDLRKKSKICPRKP